MRALKKSNYSYLFNISLLAILYFLFGQLSLLLLHGHQIVTLGLFISQGLALAFVLYFGPRMSIGIFLGQFFLAYFNGLSIPASFGIATINSFIAYLAYLLMQQLKLNIKLQTFRDIFGLVFIMFIIETIGSLSANALLIITHNISDTDYFSSAFSWWFGNIMGELVITPMLLLLFINQKNINLRSYLTYGTLFLTYSFLIDSFSEISSPLLLLSLSLPIVIAVTAYKGFVYGTLLSSIAAFSAALSVYERTGAFCLTDTTENVINYNLFILAHVSIVYITGILFDERKRNEEELHKTIAKEVKKNEEQQLFLMRQARLAQMGEMIAMIAHQWRQPLNNLSLANQLLISKYKKNKLDDKTMQEFSENSKKQITQMSETVDDFRNFFKEKKEKTKFCVNELIDDILNMTHHVYVNDGIDLQFIQKESLYIYGHPNELGQVILNILNNAKDALNEQNKAYKKIFITLEKQDGYVCINIEDNAGGIPQSIQKQIYDPYFSTKDEKNGTGLGLYMAKMIIHEKFQGILTFENTNDGAIFQIMIKDKNSVA